MESGTNQRWDDGPWWPLSFELPQRRLTFDRMLLLIFSFRSARLLRIVPCDPRFLEAGRSARTSTEIAPLWVVLTSTVGRQDLFRPGVTILHQRQVWFRSASSDSKVSKSCSFPWLVVFSSGYLPLTGGCLWRIFRLRGAVAFSSGPAEVLRWLKAWWMVCRQCSLPRKEKQ